jgi:hypothetical protein
MRVVQRLEFDDHAVWGVESGDFEIGGILEVEYDARGSRRCLSDADALNQSVANNFMNRRPPFRDPGAGMRDIDEQAIGVCGAIRPILKWAGGFDDYAG